MLTLAAARKCCCPRSCQFLDSIWLDQFYESFNLVRFPCNLDNEAVLAYIDDGRPEWLYQGIQFIPCLRRRLDFDEGQFPRHDCLVADIIHLDDIDLLIQLLGDLFNNPVIVDMHDTSNAGAPFLLGMADRNAFNIVIPFRKEIGNPI